MTRMISANPLKFHKILVIFCAAMLAFLPVFASNADEPTAAEEEFNAGEMIAHHIADSHVIHMWGNFHIPLPVILYTDKGLDVFMSSVFHYRKGHPTTPYTSDKTGYTYTNHHEAIYIMDEHASLDHEAHGHSEHTGHQGHGDHDHGVKPMDFSLTKSVVGMFLIIFLMVLLFGAVKRGYRRANGGAPRGVTNLMETLILFVRDEIAVPNIGKKKAERFLPFLLTVFFFIWMCNLLGLIPFLGAFNITGTMGVTIVLATIVFIMTTVNGNGHYWGHIFWPPGVPLLIKPILILIEAASIFIKPLVLMIRLTANISAGHIIILALVSLVMIFSRGGAEVGTGIGVAVGSTLFMIFIFFIELLVAFLQAYVFTLLASIYFGEATHDDHH